MLDRSSIFGECGRVVMRGYGIGAEEAKQYASAVSEARQVTLAIAREITQACEDDVSPAIVAHMRSVLSDLHPEVRYLVDGKLIAEKLVRDLAEVCTTFRCIELGLERNNRERLLEAKVFCTLMCDELKQIGQ